MYECYTGRGDDKTVRYKNRDLDAATVFAHNLRGLSLEGPHVGIMRNGKVMFSTDAADSEYLEHLAKSKT